MFGSREAGLPAPRAPHSKPPPAPCPCLRQVDLTPLSREQRMAFFINVYNALVIHALVAVGHAHDNAFGRWAHLIGRAAEEKGWWREGVVERREMGPGRR